FACGAEWGLDFLLNIALFVPLGAALQVAKVSWRTALLLSLALTTTVEMLQFTVVSGRVASTGDLTANTLGGMLGFALSAYLRTIAAPAGRSAALLVGMAGILILAILAGTAWAFGPAPTEHPYWGQFAPKLGKLDQFQGSVVRADVDGIPLRDGRLATTAAVRDRLRRDGVVVRAVVHGGAPTELLAPVVSIFDGEHNEILLVGQHGTDLVFRMRRRSTQLGFRTPSVSVWDVFPRMPPGSDTSTIQLTGTVGGYAIGAVASEGTETRTRFIHFRPTFGWALLIPFEHLYTPRAQRFTSIWLALLFAPLGYYTVAALAGLRGASGRIAVAAWSVAVTMLGIVVLPLLLGLAPGTQAEWRGVALGLGGGALLAGLLVPLLAAQRAPDSHTAHQRTPKH
ncbi:MAG TPA: VanZ family protein, partial [Gemmatimonadaceae bacterium]|nr:VanZ family protein [Gemmatimonadaceae bacterium]